MSEPGPVVIAGAGGMLGSALAAAYGARSVGLGRDALQADDLAARLAALAPAPAVVINCAAHTNVDAAEHEPDAATAVNATLAERLAAAARASGAAFVQLSSTGCYGDWKSEPYVETDPLRPTTAHHRSKAAGEAAVLAAHRRALIVRTGWLFGGAADQPKNFVWKRILEARGKAEMVSDDSQTGNPTFVSDLAAQIVRLVEAGASGVYNVVGVGSARRSDYVRAIVEAAELDCQVVAAPPGAFVRAAKVSPNEAALNARLDAEGVSAMRPWREALAGYVAELRQRELVDA